MRRKSERYSPVQKAEAFEVVVCERQMMMFLNEINKDWETERFTTEITMFEFRKYVQKKKDSLDPNLFEYATSRADELDERKREQN